jgi:hypothetical protein
LEPENNIQWTNFFSSRCNMELAVYDGNGLPLPNKNVDRKILCGTLFHTLSLLSSTISPPATTRGSPTHTCCDAGRLEGWRALTPLRSSLRIVKPKKEEGSSDTSRV